MPVYQEGALSVTVAQETALMLYYLLQQVADSATWQALVRLPLETWDVVSAVEDLDAEDRDNALDAIHFDRRDNAGRGEDVGSEIPICLLRPWDEYVSEFAATATWDITGMILMTFEIPIPTDFRSSVKLATFDFWAKMDAILSEIRSIEQAERLCRPRIRRVILPGEIDPRDNQGRRVRTASYSVTTTGVN